MQRARMLAWQLPSLGWQVEILTPAPTEVREDIVEDGGDEFFRSDVPVHAVRSVAKPLWTLTGSRSHAWRTLLPLMSRGGRLLRSSRFDLVYFSTASFVFFALGPVWQRRFGVPYIVDFHDPWFRERAANFRPWRFKPWLSGVVAAGLERSAVVNAAGLVAVSPVYIDALRRRYESDGPAWLAPERHAVIPFGALESDLASAARPASPARRNPGELTIHYVGAGGSIMLRSFDLLCRALALLRQQGDPVVDRVRVRLFGTLYNWRAGDAKPLESLARAAGVENLVSEDPRRVSYRRSLELLLESDGALILGVDDDGYMPSKLFSYALSGKPLLASLRRDGPAFAQFNELGNLGHAIWFDRAGEMPLNDAARVMKAFLDDVASGRRYDRRAALEPFLAPAMARRHAQLFDACVTN